MIRRLLFAMLVCAPVFAGAQPGGFEPLTMQIGKGTAFGQYSLRLTEAVRIQTGRNMEWLDVGEMVKRLNQKLGGWANYFKLGPVTPAYRFIDRYTTIRLRRWLCKKHKQSNRGLTHYPDEHFYQHLGLIRLSMLPQNFPWAKA